MKEPKIRFKGFEGEWEKVKLGDVGIFKSNGVDKTIHNNEKIVNLLNYLDVYNARLVTKNNCHQLMHVSASDRQIKECDIQMNDVFFTPSSETAEDIGHVLVIKETLPNTCYSYHLLRYRPNKGIFYGDFPNYGFATKFVRSQMRLLAKGVQRYVIGKSEFESIVVQIPSFAEQRAIASYITILDRQISLQTQRLASLKQIKAASLQAMFPQEGETVPKLRFKGFEGEWEKVRASNVFKTFNEKNRPDLPVLSATQDRGMVTRESIGYNIFHDKSNEATYKHILPGQFIIHLRSFQGGFAHSSIEGIASPAYTIMEFKDKTRHFDLYWKYIFVSKEFIKRLELITYGIRDGRSISFEEFSEMYFTVPSYEEQKKIASYITILDRQISLQTQRLEKLKQIKAACLDNMFV